MGPNTKGKTLRELTRVNDQPITKDNQSVVAYVALVMADEMRKDGMPMFADILEAAAARLAIEHGRLPPRTFIPLDVHEAVWEQVRTSFLAEAMKAAPTKGQA
jgi:hypothetical protein